MRYRYSHRRALARHGITPCHKCNGEGFHPAGRNYETQRTVWCSACDATGWYRDEAHGMHMKRVSTHRMEIAA